MFLLFLDQYYVQGGSPDSFWDKFLLSLCTAILTFGFSLGIAYLGFKWIKKKEIGFREDEKKETDLELINYVITSLEQNINAIKSQIRFLNEYIKNISTINNNIELIIETSVMFDWTKNIDTPKFRNVFFKYYPLPRIEDKRQDFVTLLSRSNHLTILYKAIESYNQEFVTLRNTDQLIYRSAIIELEYKVITKINKTDLSQFEKELFKLHSNYATYSGNERDSLTFTNENLLKPMKELVEKSKDYELWKDLEICMGAYNDIDRHFKTALKKHSTFVNQFDKSSEYIKMILEQLLKIKRN